MKTRTNLRTGVTILEYDPYDRDTRPGDIIKFVHDDNTVAYRQLVDLGAIGGFWIWNAVDNITLLMTVDKYKTWDKL